MTFCYSNKCVNSTNISNSQLLLILNFTQTWRDQRLTWNATAYGGIQDVKLPISELWTPDMMEICYSNVVKLV